MCMFIVRVMVPTLAIDSCCDCSPSFSRKTLNVTCNQLQQLEHRTTTDWTYTIIRKLVETFPRGNQTQELRHRWPLLAALSGHISSPAVYTPHMLINLITKKNNLHDKIHVFQQISADITEHMPLYQYSALWGLYKVLRFLVIPQAGSMYAHMRSYCMDCKFKLSKLLGLLSVQLETNGYLKLRIVLNIHVVKLIPEPSYTEFERMLAIRGIRTRWSQD